MTGDQPPGKMNCIVNKLMHCDGFPDVGTIVIDYSMHAGKRGNITFPGTHRTAYLPDNKEGNEVL
jgi:deltex-like protein